MIKKDLQYYKFCSYGFFKNMRFFDPFIMLFFREIGFTYFQIGILFSIREISNTILEIPSGIIADYFGRKNSMLFSFISYIISFIIFSISNNYYLFILAMFLFANGESFRSGTHKAMIVDYLKMHNISEQKTEYYGNTRAWSQIGSAISSLIAGALVVYTGQYRIIFIASIFPYIIDLIILSTYPKALNGIQNIKYKKLPEIKNIKLLFTKKEYQKALLNSSIYDGLFKSIKDYIQPILQSFALSIPIILIRNDNHRSTITIAIVYFILYFLSAGSSKNAHKVNHFFNDNSKAINITFLFGVFITIISGIFFTLKIDLISIIFFIGLFILQNLRRPLNMNYITEHIPKNLMATGLSIESQIKNITIAIFSPLIGYFSDIFGVGYGIAIIALFVILIYPILKVR